jgi:hypothetical protein
MRSLVPKTGSAISVELKDDLPFLPEARLRSKAARASASGKTESIAGLSSPASIMAAISASCPMFGSTRKNAAVTFASFGISGGSSTTVTSRPPARISDGACSRRSPPAVSRTRSTGSSDVGIRPSANTSSAPRPRAWSPPAGEVRAIT